MSAGDGAVGRIRRGYLEYFLVDHCNLRCAHCSHFSPFMKAWSPSLEEFESDLAALAQVMEVGRFRFLGGEPLLNRQLPEFIAAVRRSGLARQVGLCTNGVLLHKANPETLARLDWLDVSLYPGTVPDSATIEATARRLSEEIGVRLALYSKPEFRYQILDQPIEDPALVRQVFETCKMAHGGWDMFHDGCHTVYRGHYFRCNRPAYTRRYLESQGHDGDSLPDFSGLDGVALHGPDLGRRLLDYLLSQEPLSACRWCLGTCGVKQPHRMMTRDEVKGRTPTRLSLEQVLDREALAKDQETVRPIKSRTRKSLQRQRAKFL
jgi:organic radical activating enzyme